MYGGSLKKTLSQPPKVTNRKNVKSRENEIRAEGGIEKWHIGEGGCSGCCGRSHQISLIMINYLESQLTDEKFQN